MWKSNVQSLITRKLGGREKASTLTDFQRFLINWTKGKEGRRRRNLFGVGLVKRVNFGLGRDTLYRWEIVFLFTALHFWFLDSLCLCFLQPSVSDVGANVRVESEAEQSVTYLKKRKELEWLKFYFILALIVKTQNTHLTFITLLLLHCLRPK